MSLTARSSGAAAVTGDMDVITPIVRADETTSAIRLKIVLLDIFFLSLVKFEDFSISARRPFDLLIPSSLAHTCNANEAGNLVIQWECSHHLFARVLAALKPQSQVALRKVAYDLRIRC